MCVIIKRDPGILIPEEKIISACKVNPDGWGISVFDRGKLETRTVYEKTGNNPDKVIKALEDAKDQTVYLHLRFQTAGEKSVLNCHPFTLLDEGGYKVAFMHNGTISGFTDEKLSDTRLFANKILSPLIRAFRELDGEGVLDNQVVKDILEKYRGYSVFTLYDSNGKELFLENSSCKQFEGWWASNEYSFNRYHREKEDDYYYSAGTRNRWHYPSNGNMTEADKTPWGKNTGATGTSGGALTVVAGTTTTATSTEKKAATDPNLGHALARTKKRIKRGLKQDLTPPAKRITFLDLLGADSLQAVEYLDEEEIYDLVKEEPEATTALIMDLIWELYQKRRRKAVETATRTTDKGYVHVG